jgi:hypothetical protein
LVSNLFGTLAADDSFQLFSSSSGVYAGAFSSIQLASPGPGLLWQTNQLNASGVLSIIAGPLFRIGAFSVPSRSLVFSGSNGVPGSTFYILTTTNLSLPPTNWVTTSTNVFDSNGGFMLTNNVETNVPQQFFQLYFGPIPPN